MKYHSGGIDERAWAGIFQGMYLLANRFHYLLNGGTWVASSNGQSSAFQVLAN